MRFLSWAFLVLLPCGFAAAMPMTEGYFKVTRRCSDGSVPRDTLGDQPLMIHFGADGKFETLAQVNSRCSQYTSGYYDLTFEYLRSRVTASFACAPCEPAARTDTVTQKSKLQSHPHGFVLQLFTTYGAGGSCSPGQAMNIDFVRLRQPVSMIPTCAIAQR